MLGDMIKRFRSAKGWTQGAFAEKLHVTIGYISEIETGRRMPSLSTLISMIDLLECSPNEILEYKEKEIKKSPNAEDVDDTIKATVKMMISMEPEERYKVFSYARDQKYLSDYFRTLGRHPREGGESE